MGRQSERAQVEEDVASLALPAPASVTEVGLEQCFAPGFGHPASSAVGSGLIDGSDRDRSAVESGRSGVSTAGA